MKRLAGAIFAALIVGVAPPVWGAITFTDGNELYQSCQDENAGSSAGYCFGYIFGVIDSLDGPDRGINGTKFCLREGVTGQQVRDIVKNWLNANPQHRDYISSSLVAVALAEAFPCK
mgnify:CR=1 FL=1